MDTGSLDPVLTRSVVSWLAAQAGRRVRIEFGTYAYDPALSRSEPVLSIVTCLGELSPRHPDRMAPADSLTIDLPEVAAGNLRIEPSQFALVAFGGGTDSLHIYSLNETFIAILPPFASTVTPEGAAPIDSLPPQL